MKDAVTKLGKVLESECACHRELLMLAELQGELILKQDGSRLLPVLNAIEGKLLHIVELEDERQSLEARLEECSDERTFQAVRELSSTLASLADILKKMLIVNRRNALAMSAADDYMRFCAELWIEQSGKNSYAGAPQRGGEPAIIDGRI